MGFLKDLVIKLGLDSSGVDKGVKSAYDDATSILKSSRIEDRGSISFMTKIITNFVNVNFTVNPKEVYKQLSEIRNNQDTLNYLVNRPGLIQEETYMLLYAYEMLDGKKSTFYYRDSQNKVKTIHDSDNAKNAIGILGFNGTGKTEMILINYLQTLAALSEKDGKVRKVLS